MFEPANMLIRRGMPEVMFKGVQTRFNELLLRGYLLALDPWLAAGRGVFGIEFVNRWLLASPSRRVTGRVLRRFGAQVAATASVPTHLIIDNAVTGDYRNLRLGHLAYLGKGCFLDLVAPIDIGDEASVSGACVLLTHGDPGTGRFMEQTYFPRATGPIRIDRYAWIGAGAVLLPGVQIGECSVVGAGAVVTADVEPFTVVAGVPARLIRRLPPAAPPEKTPA
jgi:acetyltransferase-like isoleucine patch superfamily enzyme